MKKHSFATSLANVFFTLTLTIFCFQAFGQVPSWKWAETATGSLDDYSKAVATDNMGNTYITGNYKSPVITFGSTNLNNTGFSGIFVVKYDVSGKVVWAKNAGGTDDDGSTGIAVDGNGNVFITGYFNSPSLTFGTSVLNNTSVGSSDVFVAKFDKDGKALWAKSAIGIDNDRGNGVGVDGNGNVYITGSYKSPNIDFGASKIYTSGVEDLFIAKYNSSGTLVWSKGAGGSAMDYAQSISVDAMGNSVICGDFRSPSLTFGSTGLNNAGAGDFYVTKYDSSGKVLWAKSAGGSSYDFAKSVAFDPTGNVMITGYFTSPTLKIGTTTLTNAGDADAFIAKMDANGDPVWLKAIAGNKNEYGNGICTDGLGNIYFTGVTETAALTVGTDNLTNNGNYDILVVKYNASGNVEWSKLVGGTYYEVANSIAADLSGNDVFITGDFASDKITFGNSSLIKNGGQDIFVAKLSLPSASVDQTIKSNNLQLYPNPGNGSFYLSSTDNIHRIEIFNAYGQLVSSSASGGLISINPLIDKGYYMVKVSADSGTRVLKYFKN